MNEEIKLEDVKPKEIAEECSFCKWVDDCNCEINS